MYIWFVLQFWRIWCPAPSGERQDGHATFVYDAIRRSTDDINKSSIMHKLEEAQKI